MAFLSSKFSWISDALGKVISSASFLSMISTALRVGGGLLTLPIALRTIPQEEIGLYYTFLAITGIVALFDFGFAPTVSRNAAYAMAGATKFAAIGVPPFSGRNEPNLPLLSALIHTVRRYYRFLGIVLGVIICTFGSWFIYDQIKRADLSPILITAWLLFAVANVYAFSAGFWQNILMGIGAVSDAARIGLIAQIIGLVLLVGGLLCGLRLWAYGLSVFVWVVLGALMARRRLSKHVPGWQSARGDLNMRQILNDLWPMAWRMGVVMLGSFLINRGNTIVCSAKLGLHETASYGLTLNLLTILFQVATIPVTMVMPQINKLRVSQDHVKIWRIFATRLYGGLTFGAIGILCLALCGQSALALIGSNTRLLEPMLVVFLGVVIWLENHHGLYSGLVLTENRNPFIFPALISGIFVVALGWVAAGRWGVVGLIGAQAIVQAAWNNWWTVLRGMKGLRSPSPGNTAQKDQPSGGEGNAESFVAESATGVGRY